MPTLVKHKSKENTYVCHTVEEIVDLIKQGTLYDVHNTPHIRFAANYRKEKGQLVVKEYCGLVPLCICNLPGEDEVNTVMEKVIRLPHTHLVWRSDNRRSLFIVCRLTWQEGADPKTTDEMKMYQQNGYKMLHYIYSSQLMMNLDAEIPSLNFEVPYGSDPEVYYNALSIPFLVNADVIDVPKLKVPGAEKGIRLAKGMTETETLSYLFHSCHKKAIIQARKLTDGPLSWNEKILSLLARYCFESGLPVGYACSHAKLVLSGTSKHEVDMAFDNAYAKDNMKEIPYGHIEKSALLTLQTEAFLNAFYSLRRNVLTGEVQYRERSGYNFDFRPLTEQVLNSMTIRALKVGIGSWDKDVRRLINSNDIEQYDPLSEYLYSLPKWDGRDHVKAFTDRIPSTCQRLNHYLHVWLLSMVAHWLGKDRLHGNAIVPLLIGDQGCGKTTLASIILPPELRAYYNDKVDFRSDSDLLTGLSNYALINMDEFDSLKKSQQPTIKYLLSKSEVKFRPAYGKTIEHRRRYASFIGTTNLSHPLTDPTGSRRFICIQITHGEIIDTHTPINYEQFYAQLIAEINQGMAYWFDDKETQELMQQNAPFSRITNLSEMIDACFSIPEEGEEGKYMSLDEIIKQLKATYSYFMPTDNAHREIGKLLNNKGYEKKRLSNGVVYKINISEQKS